MKKLTIFLFFVSSILIAQDKAVASASEHACECISKIDVDLSKKAKSKEIKSCIESASLLQQFESTAAKMMEKVKDTLQSAEKIKDTTIVGGDKNITINVGENYKEIEQYLYDNCPALKYIYFIDNKESKNSLSNRKKAKKYYEKGQVAFSQGNYEEAIVEFSKAVKKDGKFAFAWDNLGYSYRKLNNFKQAIKCYKKSLEIDPKGKMPLMNMAVAHQLNNDVEAALKSYNQYNTLYPNDPEGFYGLGRIYYMKKDYEPALVNMITAYKLYLEIDSPYNIDAQKHIQFLYKEMSDAGKEADFKRVCKENNLKVNLD